MNSLANRGLRARTSEKERVYALIVIEESCGISVGSLVLPSSPTLSRFKRYRGIVRLQTSALARSRRAILDPISTMKIYYAIIMRIPFIVNLVIVEKINKN